MNAGPLILGVLLFALGVCLAGWWLVSATRPVWSKYFKVMPPAPKVRKTVPTPLGKAVGSVMSVGLIAFCLSLGGFLIASALSMNAMRGWLGGWLVVIILVSAGLVFLCRAIFAIFRSATSTPVKPNAKRPNA